MRDTIDQIVSHEEIEKRAYEIYLRRGGGTVGILTIGLPLNKSWPKSEAKRARHIAAVAKSSR
jgi:hypothetical protein